MRTDDDSTEISMMDSIFQSLIGLLAFWWLQAPQKPSNTVFFSPFPFAFLYTVECWQETSTSLEQVAVRRSTRISGALSLRSSLFRGRTGERKRQKGTVRKGLDVIRCATCAFCGFSLCLHEFVCIVCFRCVFAMIIWMYFNCVCCLCAACIFYMHFVRICSCVHVCSFFSCVFFVYMRCVCFIVLVSAIRCVCFCCDCLFDVVEKRALSQSEVLSSQV